MSTKCHHSRERFLLYGNMNRSAHCTAKSLICPVHFTPRERAPGTHWIGGWVGPKASLNTVAKREKFLPLLELKSQTWTPLSSHCNDWAILAPAPIPGKIIPSAPSQFSKCVDYPKKIPGTLFWFSKQLKQGCPSNLKNLIKSSSVISHVKWSKET
jgi:hypothetical protein